MAVAIERTVITGKHQHPSAELLEKDITVLSRKKQLTSEDEERLASQFEVIAMMMGRLTFAAYCVSLGTVLSPEQRERVLTILEKDKEKVDGIHFKGIWGVGSQPPEYACDLVRESFAKLAVSDTMSE